MTAPPVVAGRYRLDEALRPGLDKTSFRGVDLVTDRPILACVLESEVAAATRGRLERPHAALVPIISVLDLGELLPRPASLPPAARAVAVLERPAGLTLEARIGSGEPLSAATAAALFIPLADALSKLHTGGATHGAVVPAAVEVSTGDARARLGLVGAHDGALAYSSPGRITEGVPSPADDVWALAGCLYFAASGQAPYAAESPQALARRILGGRPLPLRGQGPAGVDLQKIFDRAFARIEGQRFPTAAVFRDELDALVAKHAPGLRPPAPLPPLPLSAPAASPAPRNRTATWDAGPAPTQPEMPRPVRRTEAYAGPPPGPSEEKSEPPPTTRAMPATSGAATPPATPSARGLSPRPGGVQPSFSRAEQRTRSGLGFPAVGAEPPSAGDAPSFSKHEAGTRAGLGFPAEPAAPPPSQTSTTVRGPAAQGGKEERRAITKADKPAKRSPIPTEDFDELEFGNDRPTVPGPEPEPEPRKRVPSVLTAALVSSPPPSEKSVPTARPKTDDEDVFTSAPELRPGASSRPTVTSAEPFEPPPEALTGGRSRLPRAPAPPDSRPTPKEPTDPDVDLEPTDGAQGATRPFSREQVDRLRQKLLSQNDSGPSAVAAVAAATAEAAAEVDVEGDRSSMEAPASPPPAPLPADRPAPPPQAARDESGSRPPSSAPLAQSLPSPSAAPLAEPPRRLLDARVIVAFLCGVALTAGAMTMLLERPSPPPSPSALARAEPTEPPRPAAAPPALPQAQPSSSSSPSSPSSMASAAQASASAQPSASAASSASAPAAGDEGSCVRAAFAEGSFEASAELGFVCSETSARKGAQRLQKALVEGGRAAGKTTEAMRDWAKLGWYEMPTYAVLRARCCHQPPPLELPVLGCPGGRETIEALGQAAAGRGGDLDEALRQYRKLVGCALDTGAGPSFGQEGPPASGSETAFRAQIARAGR